MLVRGGLTLTLGAWLVLSAAAPVHGAASAHLDWSDCGASGTTLRTFACDTNSGSERMVVSFVPPDGITAFYAIEARLQLMPVDGGQPAWWQLATGGCRTGALSASFSFASLSGCEDPFEFAGVGGASASTVTPGEFQMVGARNPDTASPLDSTLQYYAGIIVIQHSKSTGTGACAGCEVPRGIFLKSLALLSTGARYDYDLDSRATGVLPAYVNWQCEGEPTFEYDWERGWLLGGWEFTNCATAARRPTWGAIKHLYR